MLSLLWMIYVTMMKTTNPLKLSTLLLAASVISSINLSYKTTSLWAPSIIILTFSSGMMILFCYSSSLISMTSNAIKNSKKMWVLAMIMPLVVFGSEQNWPNSEQSMKEFTSSSSTVVLMVVLTMFMVPMMENCFNPTNPMQSNF